MATRIMQAQPAEAWIVAEMVGELLHEIMDAINSRVFRFDPAETEARARAWLTDRTYTVLLAHEGDAAAGFVALYQGYALYAEGTFGTISELYVRPVYRSQGVGARLLVEAKRYARSRKWTRLEVTTPPLPEFDRTLAFYERNGFSISGGRKMKVDLT
ncbi:MAG TPA: GNAT family N-acetyltransferase [Nitrospira sp.]|nr:GNAT family N-acetyltransferase [Nitrospira sp.]